MRELTYLIASTIDGFITDPGGGNPDFYVLEGAQVDFLRDEYPETMPTHVRSLLGIADVPNKHFDTVLQGRGSWDIGMREGITNAYRHLRSIVFSRSITESPDPTVEFVATDPVERVRALKQEPGSGIWLCGGGKLAAALRAEIDELIVKLHPVTAGAGLQLFDGEFAPQRWELADARTFDSGVVILTYRRS